MPITKHHFYPQHLNQISNTFKVLSCPARFSILKYLLDQGAANNKELVQYLGLSQSTVSPHLAQLLNIVLLVTTQHETSMLYRIDDDVWKMYLGFMKF